MMAIAAFGGPSQDVEKALRAFSGAVAAGESERVSGLLHPNAVQVVDSPTGQMVLTTEVYLSLIGAGTVGGTPITVDVQHVDVRGSVASATVLRDLGSMKLQDAVSLIHTDGDWRIVAMAVTVVP